MTDVQVYFNRPLRPAEGMLEAIEHDLAAATKRICVASAWFTDTRIAEAVIRSPAQLKVILLNGADVNRDSQAAVKRLIGHMNELWGRPRIDWPTCILGDAIEVLGSPDRKEGMMHHKFILVDDDVVWAGSYNFTVQARKNYENLLRIADRGVCTQFWGEVDGLFWESPLWSDSGAGFWDCIEGGIFRCAGCRRLFLEGQMAEQEEDIESYCRQCAPPVPAGIR